MQNIHRKQTTRGFTLIELLICVAMLPMIALGTFGLAAAMQSRARNLHERSYEGALIRQSLETWRRDAELATSISITPGERISLELPRSQGFDPHVGPPWIEYKLAGSRLIRREYLHGYYEEKPGIIAAESVASFSVTRESGAWHFVIKTANGEGPERIERTYEAWASPIAPTRPEGKR